MRSAAEVEEEEEDEDFLLAHPELDDHDLALSLAKRRERKERAMQAHSDSGEDSEDNRVRDPFRGFDSYAQYKAAQRSPTVGKALGRTPHLGRQV